MPPILPFFELKMAEREAAKPETREVKKDAAKPEAGPEQKTESSLSPISAATTLANKNSKLTEAEAAELKKKVAQNPEDVKSITMLLGYYFLKQADKDMTERDKYILWLIKNHPEAGVLGCPYGQIIIRSDNYPEAKKLWLEQMEKHPDDVGILENVAHFFSVADDSLSIKCYEKLIKLNPENSQRWYRWLGGTYSRNATYGHYGKPVDAKEAAADFEKAFQAYENAYSHSTAKEKQDGFVLRPLIVAARKAGKSDKAGEYIKILEAIEASTTKESGPAAKPVAVTAGGSAQETVKNKLPDVKQKLDKIIFPEVEFKDADIFTVIRYLNRSSKRYDPDYEGVSVVAGFSKEQADSLPKITLKQTQISLGKLLDDICRGSSLKYRIDEGIIVISANKPETAPQAKDNNSAAGYEFTIKLATTAAEKWLALVDDGKYPESWAEAAAYFKNAVTAAAWEQAAKEVRPPFGKLLSRKVKSAVYHTSLPGAPDGRYVVIQFETSFENKKEAIETVTPMADPDGQWRVSGYYVK